MKALLLILATTLLPFTANADFRAGRVRTSAEAELKVLNATGKFAGKAHTASVTAQVQDDKQGYVSYTLTLDGAKYHFRVVSTEGEKGGCGITQEGLLDAFTTGEYQYSFSLTDFTTASCERVINNLWEVELSVRSINDGSVSTIYLGGNPEYFMLTMSL